MAADKPVPIPTQLYAIEVHDKTTDELFHVISHPVRATRDTMAVREAALFYGFNAKHWMLKAVPAATDFH